MSHYHTLSFPETPISFEPCGGGTSGEGNEGPGELGVRSFTGPDPLLVGDRRENRVQIQTSSTTSTEGCVLLKGPFTPVSS